MNIKGNKLKNLFLPDINKPDIRSASNEADYCIFLET